MSRQTIAGSSTALVHPAEFYVALKARALRRRRATCCGRRSSRSIRRARVAQVAVRVELVHRTWTLAREESGSAYRSVSVPVDKVVARCGVTTAAAPRSCELTVPSGAITSCTRRPGTAAATPSAPPPGVYALGEGGEGFGDSDELKVDLVPDRDSYEIGQTARIIVKSPFASADALVTVERAGISAHRKVTLSGAMPVIDVPITEDLRPNAFVRRCCSCAGGRSRSPRRGRAGRLGPTSGRRRSASATRRSA